ncbi:LamG domain-containing protein, partial [Planctomycetota bacterium]
VQSGTWSVLVGSKNVDDSHWHHLAGIYNGTTIYQYVDGELDAAGPARGTINLDSGPVYLGKSSKFSSDEWNGLIDDVRIYNQALSATEIKALYNGREL